MCISYFAVNFKLCGLPTKAFVTQLISEKFISRGQKLYVTMDKRNQKKRNKCLCWGICLGIVAAAVIIGILAASKYQIYLINFKFSRKTTLKSKRLRQSQICTSKKERTVTNNDHTYFVFIFLKLKWIIEIPLRSRSN